MLKVKSTITINTGNTNHLNTLWVFKQLAWCSNWCNGAKVFKTLDISVWTSGIAQKVHRSKKLRPFHFALLVCIIIVLYIASRWHTEQRSLVCSSDSVIRFCSWVHKLSKTHFSKAPGSGMWITSNWVPRVWLLLGNLWGAVLPQDILPNSSTNSCRAHQVTRLELNASISQPIWHIKPNNSH